MLPPMRYKEFVFPHNPRVYAVEFKRELAVRKAPMGAYTIQDLGRTCRVLRGEGEFIGRGAYDTFKALATVFYAGGAGTLRHPVWQASQAFFAELSLRQEPREDYVAYAFVFYEDYTGAREAPVQAVKSAAPPSGGAGQKPAAGQSAAVYHTVLAGDTLWAISKEYGLTLAALLQLNPAISNPNVIRAGQKVRVK